MAKHVLGVYWKIHHDRQADWDYVKALQPGMVRLLDADAHLVARVYAALPDTLIAPRLWNLDDNDGEGRRRLIQDPVAAGEWLADQYHALWQQWQAGGAKLPHISKVVWGFYNEPNQGVSYPDINKGSLAFLRRLDTYGMRGTGANLGVGHPAEVNLETQSVEWKDFASLCDYLKAHPHHFLELHEYFLPQGPDRIAENGDSDWSWLAGRHLRCPYDVPILIGELGIEGKIFGYDMERDTGWLKYNIPPEMYANWILRVVRGSSKRVKHVLLYMTDYGADEWRTFDTLSVHSHLLSRKDAMVPQVNDMSGERQVYVPVVGGPQPVTNIIDPLVLEAVARIESGDNGYGPDGRLKIRFEAHIFVGRSADWRAGDNFTFNLDKPWTDQYVFLNGARQPIHTGAQSSEYDALGVALSINRAAAYESISMGLGQVMGFNARRVGYASAEEMYLAFQRSETAQLMGMMNYFLSDTDLLGALRRKDWATIARLYNGPGNVDYYAPRLKAEYERLANL